MLDLDKTDLVNDTLIITNDDGSVSCVPREGATESELELFSEFEEAFPEGKPQPVVKPSTPIPTETDLLKEQLSSMSDNMSQFMDYVLSVLPQ